uniref:Lysophosphatidic acid receptor 1 n=1 Tax=Sus scrofa TaxID=9823 RepID=A0A4X1TF44_PIG
MGQGGGGCFYNESIAFFLACHRMGHSEQVGDGTWNHHIFIMLANLLVMVTIYVNRRFHFPIYYLMVNLAGADFFFFLDFSAGLAYLYLMFNRGPNTWRLTVSTWLLCQGLIDTSLTASMADLLTSAIEKHITVFCMQLHTRMSNQWVVVVIVAIGTMATVMGAIPTGGWNCICDIENCSNMVPLCSDSYLVSWAIFNLAHIFGCVCQRTMRMSRQRSSPCRNQDTMMSLLKTVVIVLGAFIICWIPGLVLLLLNVCCPQGDVLAYEKFFFLRTEFNSEMSATFRQILCCQRSENTSGPTEGSARSASSLSHTILAGVHSNDHSVV